MTNRDGGATTPGDSTRAADTYDGDNVRECVDYVQTGPARNLHPVAPAGEAADYPDQARMINRRRMARGREAVHVCAIMLP